MKYNSKLQVIWYTFFEELQESGFLQNQNKLKIFGFWTKIGLKMSMHLVIKSKNRNYRRNML